MTSGNPSVPATSNGNRYLDRTGVPLWATVLLSRVQGGMQVEQARQQSGSKVSPDTIMAYASLNPLWYADLMDAQAGVVNGEPISPTHLARARAVPIVDRLADMAMGSVPQEQADGTVKLRHVDDRHAISAGRTVLEVEGSLRGPPTETPTGQITAVLAKLDLTVRVQQETGNQAPAPDTDAP